MKNKKFYVIIPLIFCIILAITISAAGYLKTIEVSTDIKLSINGQAFTPTDVNGNPVDIFVYEGTTYVPIRAVSQAFGYDISYDGDTKTAIISEKQVKADNLSYRDTFIFDGFEITFYDGIEWDTLENPYSEYDGRAVFSLPITVKNISDETKGLSQYSYKQYCPKGTELHNVWAYFDKDLPNGGNIRSGGTLDSRMYFLYEGDGDYYVEFSSWSFNDGKAIEVKLPISKS